MRPGILEQTASQAHGGGEAALQDQVANRLDVLPNFFCTGASAPGLVDRLWDFARSAYFDSPLPSLFKVADAARVMRPDLKVLFITGYAGNAVLSHGHLDPGMHVLTKPFTMEALASRIKNLIVN